MSRVELGMLQKQGVEAPGSRVKGWSDGETKDEDL
jgi:hypothetical protein